MRTRESRSLIWAVILVATWSAGCDPAPTPPGPNVVLVTIDAFRADHLGARRNGVSLTPNLDEFATEGARFDNAYSAAAFTLPSLHTLATGEPPPIHRVRFWTQFGNAFHGPTVAGELRRRGYRTGFVSGHGMLAPYPLLHQGFDSWQDRREARSEWTLERAEEFLDESHGRPFFLWLHIYEPHTPYAPEEQFADGVADLALYRAAGPATFPVDNWLATVPGARGPHLADQLYAAEIRAADAAFGRLRGLLAARGLADDTVVAVTSDHGESLSWDEGPRWDHGWSVARHLVHVPLLVAGPGVPSDVRRTDLTSHLDIAPTLLRLSGQQPPAGWMGRGLFSGTRPPPFVVVETTIAARQDRPLFGVVDSRFTLRLDAVQQGARLVDDRNQGVAVEVVDLDRPSLRADPFVRFWRSWTDLVAGRASEQNDTHGAARSLTEEQENVLRLSGYLR